MEPEADRRVDGRPERRRLVRVRPRATGSPNTSAVSCTAAGLWEPPPAMRSEVERHLPVRLRRPSQAVAQRVGEALEDGPVDVRPGVDVAEADDRAVRLRPRDAHAGRPVRLERQAHRAGRRPPATSSSKRTSGGDAAAAAARATSTSPNSRLNHSTIQ